MEAQDDLHRKSVKARYSPGLPIVLPVPPLGPLLQPLLGIPRNPTDEIHEHGGSPPSEQPSAAGPFAKPPSKTRVKLPFRSTQLGVQHDLELCANILELIKKRNPDSTVETNLPFSGRRFVRIITAAQDAAARRLAVACNGYDFQYWDVVPGPARADLAGLSGHMNGIITGRDYHPEMTQFQIGLSTYKPTFMAHFDAVFTYYDNEATVEKLEKVFNTRDAFETILLDLCRLMIHDYNYREE